jgi:hypothetical protein
LSGFAGPVPGAGSSLRPINQTIALRSNMLATAPDARDAEMLQFIEERRQQALAMIEKMRE